MRKSLLSYLILAALLPGLKSFAQVTNGTYNIQALFVQGYGRISSETTPSPTFQGKIAADTDNTSTLILNTAFNAVNSGISCYYQNLTSNTDYWGPVENISMGVISGSSTPKFDYSVLSYEKDAGGTWCTYQDLNGEEYYRDDNGAWIWGIRDASNYEPSNPHQEEISITVNGSKFRMKYAHRFTNGTSGFAPLEFGTLNNYSTYVHVNSNRSAPADFSSAIGYSNNWSSSTHSSFKNSADVTYAFTIDNSRRVILSTDHTETDFDTYLHLVEIDNNGYFIRYVGGNDDRVSGNTKSYLDIDICPGRYAVVVESYYGSSASSEGDFKLSVYSAYKSVTDGSIRIEGNSTSRSICPGTDFLNISSQFDATTTANGAAVTYTWERYNFEAPYEWITIPGETGASFTGSATNIGAYASVQIRRRAYDCGSQNVSNTVTFNAYAVSASAGTIGTAHTIPYPIELADTLKSVSNANASPGLKYVWMKKTTGSFSDIPNSDNKDYILPELTETTTFKRRAESTCDANVNAVSNEVIINVLNPPHGKIEGTVISSKGGAPVPGVIITATRVTSVANGAAGQVFRDTTGQDGRYAIESIYFGPEVSGAQATFAVVPGKGNHVFDFASLSKTITYASQTQVANFKDETVYSVTGKTYQLCYTCVGADATHPDTSAIKDVGFKLTEVKEPFNPNDTLVSGAFKSGVDGTYSINFDEEGTYKIMPRFANHVFVKTDSTINFDNLSLIPNVNFADTTTKVITGTVKADCDQYIGRAVLQFTQQKQVGNTSNYTTADFVLKDTASANNGIYSIRVPAGHYLIEVTDFIDIPLDGGNVPKFNKEEMVAFFGNTDFFPSDAMRVDVTTKDSTLSLVFHEKPQLKVVDFVGPCTKPLNPILEQGKEESIDIKAFQGDPNKYVTYQGNTVQGCPAEDDTITIFTNIESGSVAVEISKNTVGGLATPTLKPGEPTVSGNFEKIFQLDFPDKYGRSGGDFSKNDLKPVILGVKAQTGTFATVTPEIPFLILHDPPGDKSFSFRNINTSSSTAVSFATKRTNSKDVWVDAKLGVKYEAGLGVSFESAFWANLKGTFAMTTKNTSSTEQVMTMTNSEEYSTADDAVPGEEGDIYFGGAVNLLYAPVDEISFDQNTCSFSSTRDVILAPDGFATEYAYSEYHIKSVVIPNLEAIRDAPSTPDSTGRKMTNQIDVWQQILKNNKDNKKRAKHSHNISFDGVSGARTSSVIASAEKTSTIEFQVETDSTLAAGIGMELGGSGLSEGGTISLRMQTGKSKVLSNTSETTTGFTIDDANQGDYMTVDVKKDPVYGTPVFDLIAGASSCPNEVNTQKRDKVILTSDDYNITGIPAGNSQLFHLTLTNESESSEERTYYLRYVPGQSTSGAAVSIEGLGAGPFDALLANNASHDFTTSIGQFDPNVTNFQLFFEAFDECAAGNPSGADYKTNVIVKAQFDDGISPVILSAPEDGFALNSASGPNLNYSMSGYDLANLTEIALQYAAANGNSWVTAKTILKANLAANSMDSFWPYTLADGKYKFRLRLKKSAKIRYSDMIYGSVDRKGPIPFGPPQPNDFSYALGDEISQTFNENLDCNYFNASNFTIKRMSNNAVIPAVLGCYQNKIIITPTVDVSAWQGDSVAVSLINIRDAAGNTASSTFDWEFRIGAPELNTGAYLANVTDSPISLTGIPDKEKEENTNAVSSVNTQMNEDANGKMTLSFSLAQADTNDVNINFLLAGKAIAGEDYTVSGYHTFDGNEGVVKIKKGFTTSKLYFDPIADTDAETDESILVSIVNGGDYNIGGNNQIELIILNDDGADCENGGNPYNLANNVGGGTSINPGTYHKLLLESDGDVSSPTTVVFKAERSVILKPGFEVQSGSVFTAILEDCPNTAAVFSYIEGPSFTESISSKGVMSNIEALSPQAIIGQLDEKGAVHISFNNLLEQTLQVRLIDLQGHIVRDYSTGDNFPAGEHEITIETEELREGVYYLLIDGEPNRIVHRLIIKD